MTTETVSIDSVHKDPANVRRHNPRNIEAIRASLARFGQQRPIVCGADNIVIAGNGTLQAARELGWTHIQIVRTALTGLDATAFAIADNRTSETSEWDTDALAQTLAALNTQDYDLAATGFNPEEFAKLVGAESGQDGPTAPEEFQEFDETLATGTVCPRCKFPFDPTSKGVEAA